MNGSPHSEQQRVTKGVSHLYRPGMFVVVIAAR